MYGIVVKQYILKNMPKIKKTNHKEKEILGIKGLICPCCCSVMKYKKEDNSWDCVKCGINLPNKLKL